MIWHHPRKGRTYLHCLDTTIALNIMFSIALEMVAHIYIAWSQQMPMFSINLEMVKRINTAWSVVTTNAYVLHHPRNGRTYLHCLVTTNAYFLHHPRKACMCLLHCLVTTNAYFLHHPRKACMCLLHCLVTTNACLFSNTLEMVVDVYTLPGHDKCLCSPSP